MSQPRAPPPCAAVLLSSRGSSLSSNGVYPMLGRSLLVFFLLIGFGASIIDVYGYLSDYSTRDACAGSDYSCFASSVGFNPREDVNQFGAPARCPSTERRPGDVAVFKIVNGGALLYSSAGRMYELGSNGDNKNMLTETFYPGVWMMILSLSEHAKDTVGFLSVSSLKKVERSPFCEGLQSSTKCDYSLVDKKCSKVGGSKLFLRWQDVSFHEQSEMSTHKTLPISDMSFCEEGKDLRAVRLNMWRLDGICKIAPMKSKLLEANDLVCTNWRFRGTMFETSVNKEHPVVPVAIHFPKWIFVPNPSQQPVTMQSVLSYGEFVSQCKFNDKIDEHALSSRFIEIKFITTRRRFPTFDSATNEAFLNHPEIVLLGPYLFYPWNRCMQSSSDLTWHNLLDEECFPVLEFDNSKLSIVLEGSQPLWKPNLKCQLPISISSAYLLCYIRNDSSFCSHSMPKEIFVIHTGDLQLEVKKVKTIGVYCILSTVHECKGLTLKPGELMRSLVSYEEDFSTAVVYKDFELALASGVFITPIKASIPVCLLYSYVLLQWTVALFICATVCMLTLLLICIIPHSFLLGSEEYYNEVDNTINDSNKNGKIHFHHHSANFSRSSRGEENPQDGLVNRFHTCRGDENPQDGLVNRFHTCKSATLEKPKSTQLQANFSHQKEIAFSSPTLTVKPIKSSSMSEEPESGNFSTGFVKGRRRRKRRSTITGLADKHDASSSQSGNSTPSSPSSSNALIPKAAAPCSPESVDGLSDLSSEKKHQRHGSEYTLKERVSETEKNCTVARAMTRQIQSDNPNLSGMSITILPLVEFPEYGSHNEPSVAARTVLPPRYSVVPSVRAPGPKRTEDKNVTEEKNGITSETTYDIWGNYFSKNFLCWKRDLAIKMLGTSEGGSQSFFTRDPHSLVMKQGG